MIYLNVLFLLVYSLQPSGELSSNINSPSSKIGLITRCGHFSDLKNTDCLFDQNECQYLLIAVKVAFS